MGPRHGGRGELPTLSGTVPAEGDGFNGATTRRPWRTIGTMGTATRHDALQWGHDTEAVENIQLGDEYGWIACELQWGHDTEAVENYAPYARTCLMSKASMGPRHGGRGELEQIVLNAEE